MGWVSYLEDIQRRLDDAQAELSRLAESGRKERRKSDRFIRERRGPWRR